VSLYRVFLPELQALYDAFSQGKPSPLKPLPLQYADYAVWHRRWVEEIAPKQLVYWQEKLKGVVRRDILATDHPRAVAQTYHGAMETLALSMEVTTGLKELSQRSGVTLFMTLLATFLTLIWAYTHEDDLVIGSTSAGRNRSETDEMLGFFLNTIVLRTDLSGDPTFFELLQRGREELLSSLANDGIPFEYLVKELCAKRDGGKNPFFQVLFSFEPPLAPLQSNWKFTQMDIETGAAKFDLHLELDERHDGVIGRFIYNADLFDQQTIERMLQHWRDIVSRAVADPSRRISQLVPKIEELRRVPSVDTPAASQSPAPEQPSGFMQSVRRLFSKK
jgi:non-ribosomal peptide synthetase component F